jgi:thiosulfate dehydrogenase
MPFGRDYTLTGQEAFGVAAFFTYRPRPDFPGKKRDWPLGDKPKDSRY